MAPPPLIAPATCSRVATSPAAKRPGMAVEQSRPTILKPPVPRTVPSAVSVTSKRSLYGFTLRRSKVSVTLGEIRESISRMSKGIWSSRQ
jgi:hypothetical protein